LTLSNVKDSFDIVRITDPMTVRALAHPLRLDLLEALSRSDRRRRPGAGGISG
jgi:hypothetical protein